MNAMEVNALGYSHARKVADRWCAIGRMLFTTALIVGIDPDSYAYRYCYEHRAEAIDALRTWNGVGHPPGRWIKLKGLGLDELNPEWTGDERVRAAA